MENKYKDWVFTWNEDNKGLLPDEFKLYLKMEESFESFVFQKERGELTSRLHLQGCFRTRIRTRQTTLLKLFKTWFPDLVLYVSIRKMEGDWTQAQEYCTKEDTRIGERPFLSPNLQKYTARDVSLFEDRASWFPWQVKIYNMVFDRISGRIKNADDRSIIWITDKAGNTGKSKFTKYLCHRYRDIIKVPFGTSSQIRSAVIAAGMKRVYLIDIPRTLGSDDSLQSVMSAIEDIKNGFVTSAMYGKYESLLFEPPHVFVFSNDRAPTELLSLDRWERYEMLNMSKDLELINY